MIEKSVLPNGLTILTESLPHLRSVSVGLFVEAGSQDERPNERGVAHFIEHMLFKGTKKRSAKEIAEIVEASGSQMNAYTTKDYTCYYIKALDEHLELSVDILSEMIRESTFAEEMIEREKQVVLEEIKMYLDSPEDMVHDLFAQSMFSDHPLGQSIIGLEETVSAFDRDLILGYFQRMYVPENMVFVAVGNVEHEAARRLVERNLGELSGSKSQTALELPDINVTKLIQKKDIEQMHLVLGTDTVGRSDNRKYALHLLESIIGGSMSSRLFQTLREDRGLVYSTYSFHNYFYDDLGIIGMYAGFSPGNLEVVVDLTMQELKNIKDTVTEDELKRVKEQSKGALVFALESPSSRMTRLARNEIYYKTHISEEHVLNEINKVTLSDIKEIAAWQFNSVHQLAVAVMAPSESDEDKLSVLKSLDWGD